jgi:Permuted papain-like amidase enzyme, YaeF/YiiX, C92 family
VSGTAPERSRGAWSLSPRAWLAHLLTRILTAPWEAYEQTVPNDLARLKRHLRKGDVILVEGNQRVSQVIKYLTQSQWSHAAIYVGDDLRERRPGIHASLVAEAGAEAEAVVIEALLEGGVIASPIAKYRDFNIRVCRPRNLRADDLESVLGEVTARLAQTYDRKHVLDLARYFLPLELVPWRFRRRALTFGSGEPTQVICSTMIAHAFHNVGFPILPTREAGVVRPRTLLHKLLRRPESPPFRYQRRRIELITPREFDLSPYFEIVKSDVIEDARFDYREIRWAEDGKVSVGS